MIPIIEKMEVYPVAGHDCMELILATNYMIDGVPMVYCGNEIADQTRVSMFANRFHPGAFSFTDRNTVGAHVDRRKEIIKTLNAMRAELAVLSETETQWIPVENDSILAFKRAGTEEEILFAGNFSENDSEIVLESGEVLLSNNAFFHNGTVRLSSYGYIIIRRS